MSTETDDLRVAMAEFRGEVKTALAEVVGELRLAREQTQVLADKVGEINDQVKAMQAAQPGYVTKKEVDRKIHNSAAVVAVVLGVLGTCFQFFFTRAAG